jgi:hypothetical protein
MRIMSVFRAICLILICLIYGACRLFCLTLKLSFLIVAVWLIHSLFGKVGDFLLAMPVIYLLSCFLPNPRIGELGKSFTLICKNNKNHAHNHKAEVVDILSYRRGAKP